MAKKNAWQDNIYPNLELIEAWTRDGATEKEIAEKIGVSVFTIQKYKRLEPALSLALAHGKEYTDLVEIVGAYKRRATGYNYHEVTKKYKFKYNPDGSCEKILDGEFVTTKHVAGDARALENWLRLRQRESWANAVDSQYAEVDSGVIEIPVISDREE